MDWVGKPFKDAGSGSGELFFLISIYMLLVPMYILIIYISLHIVISIFTHIQMFHDYRICRNSGIYVYTCAPKSRDLLLMVQEFGQPVGYYICFPQNLHI